MGGIRHRFQFRGREAWLVEPPDPAPGKPWFAVPQWPSAFPHRNGVRELLSLGFYMVHVNLSDLFANDEALSVMHSFYLWLQERGFAVRGALIGMSRGGLYSFRFAEKHPECVSCIYADAPVCRLDYVLECPALLNMAADVMKAYGIENREDLKNHPLSPVNHYSAMAKAGIPVLMILGLDDNVVNHKNNGSLLAERYKAAGGRIQVIGRPSWGHHPHGLDEPVPIVNFILRNSCR